MSSSICQGLQSCLEPRLMEPRVLRLKLTPSKSNSSRPPATVAAEEDFDLSAPHSDPQIETHLEMGENDAAGAGAGDSPADNGAATNGSGNGVGGWSFLQALSGVYVPPPAKQYSPAMALSGKSLDMCTESLGSETGSDGSEIGGDEKMPLFLSDETEMSLSSASGEKPPRLSRLRSRKLAKPSYPPPLASMSGPMGLKVKPHREGGRLVLQAVSIPSAKPCFEVERGGGRLRLRLLKHCRLMSSNLEEEEEEEEVEEVEDGGEREEESNESGGRRRKGRRCKEGGSGGRTELLNWEPFMVST